MINLNLLVDDSILICPNNIKDEIIKNKSINNIYSNIKFMSKEDLIKGFYFSYDINAIYYLVKNYNYSFDLASEVLDNLCYITINNVKFESDKLNKLYGIYNELINNKLLNKNDYFKHLFSNKKIYIYGYSALDKELINILNYLSSHYEFIEKNNHSYKHNCYKFNDINEEVIYVMNEIGKLISSGVSLNNIYFYTIPSEYKLILKKQLINHKIPYEFNEKIYLIDTPIFKEYLSLLNSLDLIEAYKLLQESIKYDPLDVMGLIVNLIVEVKDLKISSSEKINILKYLAGKTSVKKVTYDNSVKEVNYHQILNDDDYIFMLGFSLGSYPVIHKDTMFYLDKEKEILNVNTSAILNEIEEEYLIDFINNNKNLKITFKEKVGKNVYYPSLLIDKLNIELIDGIIDNNRYSTKQTEFEVAKYKDLYKSYGEFNKWMNTFTNEELKFNIYNHLFKGLTSYNPNEKVSLSYTKVNEYNSCPFKYFVSRILNANVFNGDFKTELGNLFHQILEDSFSKDILLEDYNQIIEEKFKTYKEKYFVNKLLPQVLDVISKNDCFKKDTMLSNTLVEENVEVKLDDLTIFEGKVDKIMYDEVSNSLIVIDYKTGNFSFDKRKTRFGLDMQLPIYVYLLADKYPNYKTSGIYIENILLDNEDLKNKYPYRFDGLTVNNQNVIKLIDPTFGTLTDDEGNEIIESIYLTGIKLKKDGSLYKSKHLIEEDEFNELIETASHEISKTVVNIRNSKFDISPYMIKDGNSNACTYCKYKDICGVESKDYRIIDLKESEEE